MIAQAEKSYMFCNQSKKKKSMNKES